MDGTETRRPHDYVRQKKKKPRYFPASVCPPDAVTNGDEHCSVEELKLR